MASRVKDIKFGSVDITDFAYWINERHRIYLKKEAGEPKPWTDDKILQRYKFTNTFRQLDRGTVALRDMISDHDHVENEDWHPELLFFNIVWYRFFNWHVHAHTCLSIGGIGFVTKFTDLETYIRKCKRTHKKIFTGAHMTTGVAFEEKHESYLRACAEAWNRRFEFTQGMMELATMQEVYEKLLSLYMVGKFIAYELVCDFRFTTLLCNATDKLTWANMGPGAQRGLKRLGYPHKNQEEGCESMVKIYGELIGEELIDHRVAEHLPFNEYHPNSPFEMREVEHSLCEFDKYCRVRFGEGRPRGRYPGEKE